MDRVIVTEWVNGRISMEVSLLSVVSSCLNIWSDGLTREYYIIWYLAGLTHLLPNGDIFFPQCQNFGSNLRRDHQKKSYERCVYESVDEKNLSQAVSRKNNEKKNSGSNVSTGKISPLRPKFGFQDKKGSWAIFSLYGRSFYESVE